MAINEAIHMPVNDVQLEFALVYDYDTLAEDSRETIIEAAKYIKARVKRTEHDLLAIGQRLIDVKDLLPYGEFHKWTEQEFGISERIAQNLMNVARVYGDKPETVSGLGRSVLYLLAAPTTPESARAEIEQEAQEAGQSPTKARAIDVINKHKEQPEYAEIWQLEQGVSLYLDTMPTRNLDRQRERLISLRRNHVHGDQWPDLVKHMPDHWRKKDLLQALANVADQLHQRQELERRAEVDEANARLDARADEIFERERVSSVNRAVGGSYADKLAHTSSAPADAPEEADPTDNVMAHGPPEVIIHLPREAARALHAAVLAGCLSRYTASAADRQAIKDALSEALADELEPA